MIHRAQRRAHPFGQRLERLVAHAVAERVVEPLEVVDVDQGHAQSIAIAGVPRRFGLEGLGQSAPVRHLGQRVDRHFLGQAPQLTLEVADAA